MMRAKLLPIGVLASLLLAGAAARAGELPPGVTRDWVDTVTRNLEANSYRFEPDADGTATASNHAHALAAHVASHGIALAPFERSETRSLELRLVRFGRKGALVDAPEGTLATAGARAEIRREALGLVEWYENKAEGIEQGFTIATRPADSGAEDALVLELAADGSLRPELDADAARVAFVGADGKAELHYGGLVALDANGAQLPSTLAVAGARVQIRVDDRNAAYPIVVDPLLTSSSWSPESNTANAGFGGAISTAGDFNGDGFSDIVVGAPASNRIYLFLGGPGGPSTTAAATFTGLVEPERFGYAVAAAGNVNGDAFDDIVVGAPGSGIYLNNPYGRIAVFLGNASATLSNPTTATNCANRFPATLEGLGSSVAGAGDVTGDGLDDVIVGGPNTSYSPALTYDGVVCIYPGTNTGPGVVTTGASVIRLSPSIAISPGVINEVHGFGTSVSGAGDVNGDGFGDVIVGAPSSTGTTSASVGAAFVYLGDIITGDTPAWSQLGDNRSTQTFPTALFGAAVADAGDLNGDGFADIAVGAPGNDQSATIGGNDRGAIYFFHGSASGIATPVTDCDPSNFFTNVPAQYCEFGVGASAAMGQRVSTAGDLNGDGFGDVMFDEPGAGGLVHVIFGNSSGQYLISAGATLTVANHTSIGTAGDTDGDGFSEVLVGNSSYTNGQSGEGQALLFRGTGDVPTTTTSASATDQFFKLESNAPTGLLGISITAGDVNGDGFSDIIMGAPGVDDSWPFPPFSFSYTDDGAMFLAYGASCGPACFPPYIIGLFDFKGLQNGANYGTSVSATGDVNGDGYADVLVGAPFFDEPGTADTGHVFLYFGGPGTLNPAVQWNRAGFQGGAQTGRSVSIVGDVNADGYADAVICSPGSTEATGSPAGRAELFLGGPSGLASTPAWTTIGEGDGAFYCDSVAGAGDVNRDGHADVIIGGWGNWNADGRAFVYLGTASGLSSTPVKTFFGGVNSYFGSYVSTAGDVNGDGYSDVIIGSINAGRALVAAGPDFTTLADLSGPAGSGFGSSVGTPGDVNGDGLSDIVVGSEWENQGAGYAQGGARLYLGSATAISATPARIWNDCPNGFCYFGHDVAPAADVNGDGFGDLIASAYNYTNGETNEGGAFMHYGNGVEGIDREARAQADATTPIRPIGNVPGTGFRVRANGRSAGGRMPLRLDVEIKPQATPFNFLGAVSGATLDSGTAGVTLESFPFCSSANGCKWRARIRSRSPHFPGSPWLSPPENARTESDLRLFRDFDFDGIPDPADTCPTQTNSGTDTDMDGVDQVCDTCSLAPNPIFTGTLTNRTRVSGQLDDDADGRGNACDFDYDNVGPVVLASDFNQMKASVGKLMTQSVCGQAPTNNQRCGEFDHDLTGPVVSAADFNLAKAAVGKVISTTYPTCTSCSVGSGWSNVPGSAGERFGRPVCESAVPLACPYAP